MDRTTLRALVAVLAAAAALPAVAAEGKALYAKNCASCHGADGRANTGMGRRLGAADLTKEDDDAGEVARTIQKGKPPRMPAFGSEMSPDEVRAVARYVTGALRKGGDAK